MGRRRGKGDLHSPSASGRKKAGKRKDVLHVKIKGKKKREGGKCRSKRGEEKRKKKREPPLFNWCGKGGKKGKGGKGVIVGVLLDGKEGAGGNLGRGKEKERGKEGGEKEPERKQSILLGKRGEKKEGIPNRFQEGKTQESCKKGKKEKRPPSGEKRGLLFRGGERSRGEGGKKGKILNQLSL